MHFCGGPDDIVQFIATISQLPGGGVMLPLTAIRGMLRARRGLCPHDSASGKSECSKKDAASSAEKRP
jgi:hypothetical protein